MLRSKKKQKEKKKRMPFIFKTSVSKSKHFIKVASENTKSTLAPVFACPLRELCVRGRYSKNNLCSTENRRQRALHEQTPCWSALGPTPGQILRLFQPSVTFHGRRVPWRLPDTLEPERQMIPTPQAVTPTPPKPRCCFL